jgi:UDP-glucose-4-epimerase GalE
MLESNRVLVTGGAGYIGSHACKALHAAGYEPISYDNLSTGHKEAVKWGALVVADIRDRGALAECFNRFRPMAVMHFAASAYVAESVQDPLKYYDNNVHGSQVLISEAVSAAVSAFVFSSTCATYGTPANIPIDEATPQQPVNPYGLSKLVVEKMLQDVEHAHSMPFAALRYFNAAGAGGDIGESHEPETHLIPLLLMAAAGELSQVSVFGTDYATADGTAVRDYIHVSDLADAHVKALQHLLAAKPSLRLNLGTGKGYSVFDIIAAVTEVTGKSVPTTVSDRRAGDPPELVANSAAASKVLGWQPQQSDLLSIIRSAWQWHCSRSY